MKNMKKSFAVILCVILLMSLCACGTSKTLPSAYTAQRDGKEYVVDQVSKKISDGTHTYTYSLDGDSGGYSIKITYPDGSTYWWDKQENDTIGYGYGGWSDDYDENRYVSGDTLCDILEVAVPEKKEPKNVLLILILLAVGIFNTVSPYNAWYLEYGWRYKDAEPSELALGMARFGGIVAIVVAVCMIFT